MEHISRTITTFETKPSKICDRRLPTLGDNTTLGNMDGVIGYSYTGLGNGVVVVIYWVGRRGGIGRFVLYG